MPRPGYNPKAQEHRECPKCRYPMLRAEQLGGVSDMVGVPDPSASWLVDTFYAMLLGLLANALVSAALIGTLNLYRLTVGLPNEMVASVLLMVEGLAFWKLRQRLWLGWKNLWGVWYAAVLGSQDNWQGASIWSVRRNFSRGGGSGAAGFLLGSLCFFPAFHWVLGWLPFRIELSEPAMLSIIFAVPLGVVWLPEVLARSEGGLIRLRHHKRHKLMRELAPHDWVCPNCLYSESST